MVRGLAQKMGFLPRGSGMPWSDVFFSVVHVSLWDSLWVYSFTPASGSCRPSYSLSAARQTCHCHPKLNRHISARDQLIVTNLLDLTRPTVIVHHNTIIPSTRQKDSSRTKCGVSQRGWWGMTGNLLCWTLPASHTFRQGRIEGREPRQVPLISLRSEITLLMSTSGHVPWRDTTAAASLGYRVLSCRVFPVRASPRGCRRRKQTSRSARCSCTKALRHPALPNARHAKKAPLNRSELIFLNE